MAPKDILRSTSHRNALLPTGPWLGFQSWREVVFLHWQVPVALIQPYLPHHSSLQADIFNGTAWVSLVCFKVKHARLRILPPLPGISAFYEINLRTYVTCGNIPGVVFFDIHSDNSLVNILSRRIHLPYSKGDISSKAENRFRYSDTDALPKNIVDINFSRLALQPLSRIDKWLTERYYAYQQAGSSVWQFPIHHVQWPLQAITLTGSEVSYQWQDIFLSDKRMHAAHYATGVDVLFWKPREI